MSKTAGQTDQTLSAPYCFEGAEVHHELTPNPPRVASDGHTENHALTLRRLVDKSFFKQVLGVKERKFDEMDAAGIIPPGKFIGPRTRRWLYPDDFEAVVDKLQAATKNKEPATLAAGRRQRIERLKAGPAASAASAG